MKTNIKYSIVQLLFWLLVFSISLIGFIVLLTDINAVDTILWVVIVFGVLSLSFLVMLLISINNIQWFNIFNEYIVVRSPFGIVKRVLISDIKKAFKTKVSIFQIKMTSINRMHIVLCLKKSLTKASIVDAYNRKENPYIIIPYSEEAEIFICSEYSKVCDDKLIIR